MKVVAGADTNHVHDLSAFDNEEIVSFLKEYIQGKHGELAAETKIDVVSFQNTPVEMCPYLVLAVNPQTVNASNTWGSDVLSACTAAAAADGNAVVLNKSTDGVSCEMPLNFNLLMSHLKGETNTLSLSVSNHSVRNLQYQLIGGSSPATIVK